MQKNGRFNKMEEGGGWEKGSERQSSDNEHFSIVRVKKVLKSCDFKVWNAK